MKTIHVVQRRNDEGDLEFSRQIGLAVKRIDEPILGLFVPEVSTFWPSIQIWW